MNSLPGTAPSAPNPDAKLKRSLNLWQLTLLGISTQLGSGWLFAALSSASVAGPAAIISWVLGAVMFILCSLPWIELGTLCPRSGGIVRFPALSHGAFAGWVTGWGYWIGTVCLPAVEAQATLTYLGGSFPQLGLVRAEAETTVLAWPNGILGGMAILALYFALNLFGVKLLAKVNTWVTLWKVLVPTTTFLLLFTGFRSSNFATPHGFFPTGTGGVVHALATGGIAFAYLGSRQVLDYAGEARRPKRDIPLAVVGSCLVPLLVYLGLQIGLLGALDWHSAGVTPGHWAGLAGSAWASAPLFHALGAAGFGGFATVLLIDAAVSPAANGWVTLGSAARSSFAFGADGYAPTGLAKVNKFGIPWASLALALAISAVFMLPFPSWYELVSVVSAGLVLSYLMGSPIVQVLRRTAPHTPRPWRLPAARLLAPVGYVCGLFIVYVTGFSSLIQLMIITFAGVAVYGAYTAVLGGWINRTTGRALSIAFLLAWIVINARGGWFMNTGEAARTGSWSFPVYFGAMAAILGVYIAALSSMSTTEGRRHLQAGTWLIATLLAVLGLSYYGEFGPLSTPALPEPYDLAAIVVLSLASYWWAVRSGIPTEQLDQVLDNGTGGGVATSAAHASAASTPNPAEPAPERPQ